MTQLVGNGQYNLNVNLSVNGSKPSGVSENEFYGAQGPRWDDPTFGISLNPNASSLQTQALADNSQVCLSWSAVIMSTNVVDSDNDGLLDIWESKGLHLNPGTPGTAAVGNTAAVQAVAATFGTCTDYPSDPTDPCENFPKMGAINGLKDVFLQIDWMTGTDGSGYTHVHIPKQAALQMISSVFATHKIAVHFDVGNHYQSPVVSYIVPAAYARGGHVISEAPLLECPNQFFPPANSGYACAFNTQGLGYSALGWKIGFNGIANGYPQLGITNAFAHDRKDTFHYVLFGHALSVPSLINPAVPASVSGVADTPGGDIFVSLGLWRSTDPTNCVRNIITDANANICTDETGSVLVQAGTLMHELGHNLGLYHAGAFKVPNCMPNYPSVMNYLYQTRGLTDSTGAEHIDFSYGLLGQLNENSLSEKNFLGPMTYRMRYYAPPNSAQMAAGSAQKTYFCDGSLQTGAPAQVRLETPGIQIPDWDNDNNGNPETDTALLKEDINFDGTAGNVKADSVEPSDTNASDPHKLWFVDHNDWGNLNLQQVGGRLDVFGLSDDVSSIDLGITDYFGQSSLGQSSLGQSSLGQSSLGDTSQSDLGQSSLGQSSLGTRTSTRSYPLSMQPALRHRWWRQTARALRRMATTRSRLTGVRRASG